MNQTAKMNFGHRLIENKPNSFDIVLHKIKYPLTILIPFSLFVLSFVSVFHYFGQEWEIGGFSSFVFPLLGRLLATVFSVEPQIVLTDMVIFAYALGPVSFYLFTFFITKRHLPAILTALLTLLPLFPYSSQVPQRLTLALLEFDGAHIVALSFIPIAAVAYLHFLRYEPRKHLVIFILVTLLLVSISFFSLLIYLTVLFYLTISEALVGQGRKKITFFVVGFVVTMISIAMVYNVSLFNMLFSPAGWSTFKVLVNLFPMMFFLVPILGTFAFLIFDRRPKLQPLFLALAFSITFGVLHLIRISVVDSPVLDQDRYGAEVSFSFAFLIGVAITWIFDGLRAGKLIDRYGQLVKFRNQLAFSFVSLIIVSLLISLLFIPRSA